MRSPNPRRDVLLLAALGLLVNGLAARGVSLPGYMDAYYYFGGAVQLARGQGFTEPYLWNYLTPRDAAADAARRWPSHLYWMPLTSLAAAPFMAVAEGLAGRELEHSALFRAAQVPFVLAGSALPLLSFAAAQQLTGRRRHAWAAALLTLFSAYYFGFWTTTDAFALFGLAAGGALVLGGLAATQPGRASRLMLLVGLAGGLAHLARADGLLVVACVGAWWAAWGWRQVDGQNQSGRRWLPLAALAAGYAVVVLPWLARNWSVVGAPFAPGAARTLWLTHYNDFFTFTPERLTPAAYFGAGWAVVLRSKLDALRANLGTLVAVQANVVCLPLMAWGASRLRRHPLVGLSLLYGGVLLAAMTLVFTFPGARGGYLHSGAALLPVWLAAVPAGLDAAVDWAARRLPHWQPERAKPVFTALLVVAIAALALSLYALRVVGPDWRQPAWARLDAVYAQAGRWLEAEAEPGALTAVNNPPGWYYHTGRPSIVVPSDDVDTLLLAMDSFGAEWLLLDVNHAAGLRALYEAPALAQGLVLMADFADGAGRQVYLFQRDGGP